MKELITRDKFCKYMLALDAHIKSLQVELELEQVAECALAKQAYRRAIPGCFDCGNGLDAKWIQIAKLQHRLKQCEHLKQYLQQSFRFN